MLMPMRMLREWKVNLFLRNPEEEWEKIKKLPKKQRKKALKIYKRRLMRQKENLAKIFVILMKELEINPLKPLEELMKIAVEKQTANCPLLIAQLNKIRNFIVIYQQKHQTVEDYDKIYPNPKEFFLNCFGHYPKGIIIIIKGKIHSYFGCSDFKDYFRIFAGLFGNINFNSLPLKKRKKKVWIARRSQACLVTDTPQIFELDGVLTAGIEPDLTKPWFTPQIIRKSDAFIHEEQHVLYGLFSSPSKILRQSAFKRFINSPTLKEKFLNLYSYLTYLRESEIEPSAKDEILAYFKTRTSIAKIEERLLETEKKDGVYDFYNLYHKEEWFESLKKEMPGMLSERIIEKAMDKVFVKDYRKVIQKSLATLSALKQGRSREQVIWLLMPEPLWQWPKLLRRIKEAKINKSK